MANKIPKVLVPVASRDSAVVALQVAYGYIHMHLTLLPRSTAGDSTLQQLDSAINGLGGTRPKLPLVTVTR